MENGMDYERAVAALLETDTIRRCLDGIREDEEEHIALQKRLALIEGPTYGETPRAEAMAEAFRQQGLCDVHIDEIGNACGFLRGEEEGGKAVLIEAHCDTVFPVGTAKTIRQEGSVLYGPGISDNTRGLTVLCALAQIIKAFGIRTRKSVIFLATVREEGTGGFEGLEFFLRNHPEVGLAISVDGPDAEFIVHGGAGSRTQIFSFSGRGGHAYKDFAKTGNPVAAAARVAAKIASLKLPEDPRTTCVISQLHGGNEEGIHAIPKAASMSVNFRSAEQEQLEELDMHIAEAVAEGVREENDFAGGGVTVEKKQAVDVKAAFAPVESPEIQSMTAVIKGLGMEPVYDGCCLTNASASIGLGVPGFCIGGGGRAGGNHSVDEWFDTTDSYKGIQAAFLELMLVSGMIAD